MIAVLGSFRFPPEAVERVRPLMKSVIEATLTEPGCRAYAYAEDITERGFFHVTELWDSREALNAHFEAPHMREWVKRRASLGFVDRSISIYEIEAGEQI